jgi:hypothetical protein
MVGELLSLFTRTQKIGFAGKSFSHVAVPCVNRRLPLRRKNCEKSSRRTLGAASRPLAAGHVECDIHIVARGM